MTTTEKVAFLKAQLRQLNEEATEMTVGNYRRVKSYYESKLNRIDYGTYKTQPHRA